MNGVPTQCEALKGQLDELQAEKETLQAELRRAAGPEKWQIFRAITALTRQIGAASDRVNDCVRLFAHPYRLQVIVQDLAPGASVVRPVTGHIWYITPPADQTVADSALAQNDMCTFVRSGLPPAGSIGVSVDEEGSPMFDGQLFRSGPLSQLPASSVGQPAPTVEVVAAPAVTIPASAIGAPPDIPNTPIATASLTLGSGGMTYTATGTTVGSSVPEPLWSILERFGAVFTFSVNFTYTLVFSLAPSADMNTTDRVCAIRPMGATLMLPGSAFGTYVRLSEAGVTSRVVPALERMMNGIILAAVSAAIPQGSVLSARRIMTTATGLTFFPAVGRFLP